MEQKLGFCIEGEFEPFCKEFTFDEFPDEKGVMVLIFEYFKRFLPEILKTKKDYYNKPIIIDPNDIGFTAQMDYGKYVVVISIADDNSSYPDENFYIEDTEYNFQIDLQVVANEMLESLENLIKLKSAVKTLLVNMEKNLSLNTVIEGFSYGNFGKDESQNFVRQGIYRFSIQDKNFKNNG